jgi:hypothetical protein
MAPINGSQSPGNVHMWAIAAGENVASEGQITYGSYVHTICFTLRLLQGATLQCGTTTQNAVNFVGRVKITKIQNG